jgi:hypothetical protein
MCYNRDSEKIKKTESMEALTPTKKKVKSF